ncbi:MAG: prephenate dehydrogenase/arogenate dehydrogenase family protein [Anaerolineae bacterium]|nr:prephenate dehydrogenase/arogenate dehydrogenase family protein [Anaerolineae bacterium]
MSKTRITIVGCGKLGTALGLALRNVVKDAEIIGHDKDNSAAKRAESLKAVDRTQWNLPASVEGAQLILLAIPQDGLEVTLKAIAKDVAAGAIITDLCPVKTNALRLAAVLPANVAYISSDVILKPTMPDAQPDTAISLKGAAWTITPRSGTAPESVAQFANIVSALEAAPIFMDADEHDGLRLAVDALPAALGFAMMSVVAGDVAWRERKWLAGEAFNQATAQLDQRTPAELAAALMQQPAASAHWLNQTMRQLVTLRDAIESGDAKQVAQLLSQAQNQRIEWLNDWQRGREDLPPNAEVQKPSLMGSLLGQRLADQLQRKR